MHDSWKKSKPAGSFKSRSKGNSSADNGSAKPHGVARVISKRGYCSRSQAEKLVREGRVMLRGKIVTNPEAPTFEDDEIFVDGHAVTANEHIYFMRNMRMRGKSHTTGRTCPVSQRRQRPIVNLKG